LEPKVSGWILPDGTWFECRPWEHIKVAKSMVWLQTERPKNLLLNETWDHPDEEQIRDALAQLGMVKVCYHMVDADSLSPRQLRMLQQVYGFHNLDSEIEFIGRIRGKIQVRILMKLRDPDRLNTLGL
jgi:hypothetical protein